MSQLAASFDPFDSDNYGFYTKARREEPVFYYPSLDCYVVTRYEDVRAIERDTETFSATNALELIKPLCPAETASERKALLEVR